jgi:hypothetical protein
VRHGGRKLELLRLDSAYEVDMDKASLAVILKASDGCREETLLSQLTTTVLITLHNLNNM